jgi:Adenosine deaminase
MDWRSLGSVREVAKAELHAHLAGCIPTRAAKGLLREFPIDLPAGFDLEHDLSIDAPVPSLRDYFKPWLALGKLPQGQACLAKMVRLAVGALALDGVVYAELRHSPLKPVGPGELATDWQPRNRPRCSSSSRNGISAWSCACAAMSSPTPCRPCSIIRCSRLSPGTFPLSCAPTIRVSMH